MKIVKRGIVKPTTFRIHNHCMLGNVINILLIVQVIIVPFIKRDCF